MPVFSLNKDDDYLKRMYERFLSNWVFFLTAIIADQLQFKVTTSIKKEAGVGQLKS